MGRERIKGLYDIHGKAVHEGDLYRNSWGSISIVKYEYFDGRETTGHGTSDRIIYSRLVLKAVPDKLEIIGNRIENPELVPKY